MNQLFEKVFRNLYQIHDRIMSSEFWLGPLNIRSEWKIFKWITSLWIHLHQIQEINAFRGFDSMSPHPTPNILVTLASSSWNGYKGKGEREIRARKSVRGSSPSLRTPCTLPHAWIPLPLPHLTDQRLVIDMYRSFTVWIFNTTTRHDYN